MKKENIEQLRVLLERSQDWISANELASLIHVSTKSIRNYMKEIENVERGPKGYRIKRNEIQENETERKRSDQILTLLLKNRNGISLFDLSEKMYVSESTIQGDIQQLRTFLAPYHLKILSKNYIYKLKGEEKDIRKLIGRLMIHEQGNWFISFETLQQLYSQCDVKEMESFLIESAKQCGLLLNSYALRNLICHLLIILIRLDMGQNLKEAPMDQKQLDHLLAISCQKENVLAFVDKIKIYCENITNKRIPQSDMNQVIALSVMSSRLFELNPDSLDAFAAFIDRDFFNAVIRIILKMDQRYDLPHMNNVFLCQFILHVYNLYWRVTVGLSYPNPLAQQIKKDYAPIYDVAVWFCHEFSKTFHVKINEDEIGFVAFHLGSYNSDKVTNCKRISCLIVAEDYYSTSRQLIHELHYSYGEELKVLNMAPFSQISYQELKEADLILSTTPYAFDHKHVVFINPILTRKNLLRIGEEIELINRQRLKINILSFMLTLFQKDLYFRNVDAGNNQEEIIRFLCQKAEQLQYIGPDFTEDVLNREKMSSTAFTQQCAIPHGIAVETATSFVAVLHNDIPVQWNGKFVNFVLLMGIREKDMHLFRDCFDLIVNSFLNVEKTLALLKTNSWESFIQVLSQD